MLINIFIFVKLQRYCHLLNCFSSFSSVLRVNVIQVTNFFPPPLSCFYFSSILIYYLLVFICNILPIYSAEHTPRFYYFASWCIFPTFFPPWAPVYNYTKKNRFSTTHIFSYVLCYKVFSYEYKNVPINWRIFLYIKLFANIRGESSHMEVCSLYIKVFSYIYKKSFSPYIKAFSSISMYVPVY